MTFDSPGTADAQVLGTMVSTASPGIPFSNVESAPPAKVAKPRRAALVVLPILSAAALGAGAIAFFAGNGKETTNDAQIEGHVAYVAPHVAGQVKRVLVKDNQRVEKGEVLVELDSRDLAVRVEAARADLAAAQAQLKANQTQLAFTRKSVDSNLVVARGGMAQAAATRDTTRAAIEQARASVLAAESRRALAQNDFARAEQLLAGGAIARANYDSDRAQLEQASAALAEAQARLASAEANRMNSSGTLESARGRVIAAESGPEQIASAEAALAVASARVDQSRAALDQAELNLSYTVVRAEVSGVVSRRSVEAGQMAAPERPMLALVPLDDTWVVANFKEDQIARMKPGQPVTVKVDAYSGSKLSGRVDSLAGGTGSRFSLLPPDNASGNFTKVVQRVPVLIRLEPHPDVELRPGLSAEATVFTK
ncbi:MAG TPA: HlyD family secretion protein [Polyangiaceae bacterium]|nr:HlyD family secretion protein [Polyangiaceae bacterium]